jgi:hypothetical protein
MLTEVLAIYAAVVSTGSLVAYISYRSNGPVLSGEASFMAEIYGKDRIEGPVLWVNLYNRGRAPVTVHSASIWAEGIGRSAGYVRGGPLVIGWWLDGDAISDKYSLPAKIEAHSAVACIFPAREFAKTWLTRNDLQAFKVGIEHGPLKSLLLKVDTSDIDGFDRQNLPDWEPDCFTNQEYTRRE